MRVITHEQVQALARQFFPHLTEKIGFDLVMRLLEMHFGKAE